MPKKLPRVTGKQAIKAFERDGWSLARVKGSHHILKKDGVEFVLTVPVHQGEDVGAGLLKSLIKTSGLTVDEFIDLLKKKR